MLGRHHLFLSLITVLGLLIPFIQSSDSIFSVIVLGAAIGSLILDIDADDALILNKKVKGLDGLNDKLFNWFLAPLFPIFGKGTKFILTKILPSKYNMLSQHRGALHTLLGAILVTVLTAVCLTLLFLLINSFSVAHILWFAIAYFLGAVFHLIADSATASGIQPFRPLSNLKINGQRRTYASKGEMSAENFLVAYLGLPFLLVILGVHYNLIPLPKEMISITSTVLLIAGWLGFLVFVAKVKIVKPFPAPAA